MSCKDLLDNPVLYYQGQYICPNCVYQADLQKFVQYHIGEKNCCSICNKYCKVMPLDEFLAYVKNCIISHYDDAANFMPHDSREGGYMGGQTYDTYDLIKDELFSEESLQLQDILQNYLGDKIWGDTYADSNAAEPLWNAWEHFKNIAIKQYRYTFLALQMHPTPNQFTAANSSSPKDTLSMLQSLIQEYQLFTKIPFGTIFYRARVLGNGSPCTIHQLCPPPAKLTPAGRMNSVGISLFYCSADKDTCLHEINTPLIQQNRVVAHFKNLRELIVLDLTNLPSLPSIFSEKKDERPTLQFLHGFAQEISEPLPKDDNLKLQYIPTQILTEYFRYFVTESNHKKLDGICYQSAVHPSGKNYALFFDQNDFKDVNYENVSSHSKTPSFELVETEMNPLCLKNDYF